MVKNICIFKNNSKIGEKCTTKHNKHEIKALHFFVKSLYILFSSSSYSSQRYPFYVLPIVCVPFLYFFLGCHFYCFGLPFRTFFATFAFKYTDCLRYFLCSAPEQENKTTTTKDTPQKLAANFPFYKFLTFDF